MPFMSYDQGLGAPNVGLDCRIEDHSSYFTVKRLETGPYAF